MQHAAFERYQFWKLKQEPEESLGRFMLRAQEQVSRYKFGKNPQDSKNIAVIDKIIQLCPQELREKLLQKQNLTIDLVNKMVNSYQAVKQQASQMGAELSKESNADVNRVYEKNKPEKKISCTRCGSTNHKWNDPTCPALGKVCRKCRKLNHFEDQCLSKVDQFPRKRRYDGPQPNYKRMKPNYRQGDFKPEYLNFINNTSDDNAILGIKIGGILTQILIDSGSMMRQGLMTESKVEESNYEFRGYSTTANPLEVVNAFKAIVSVDDYGQ